VVSTTATVKVAAGEFKDCLKVRELDRRYPKNWRFDYYCPDVGRAKTTIGGGGTRTRTPNSCGMVKCSR